MAEKLHNASTEFQRKPQTSAGNQGGDRYEQGIFMAGVADRC